MTLPLESRANVVPDTPVRFAVLGCGRIGKMHAEMLARQVPGTTDVRPAASTPAADIPRNDRVRGASFPGAAPGAAVMEGMLG
mgnify:CR=1 FL=1